ncbi:hypothetical protein BDQ17DRAFT_1433188 [Cyathus striatus]|nr:hypothetical protein BDQ17DRAFT_1433188 [Cyathus striatus]
MLETRLPGVFYTFDYVLQFLPLVLRVDFRHDKELYATFTFTNQIWICDISFLLISCKPDLLKVLSLLMYSYNDLPLSSIASPQLKLAFCSYFEYYNLQLPDFYAFVDHCKEEHISRSRPLYGGASASGVGMLKRPKKGLTAPTSPTSPLLTPTTPATPTTPTSLFTPFFSSQETQLTACSLHEQSKAEWLDSLLDALGDDDDDASYPGTQPTVLVDVSTTQVLLHAFQLMAPNYVLIAAFILYNLPIDRYALPFA